MYSFLASATILLHFLFIIFVVCGGLWVIRCPQAAFIHLPAAVWGATVEIFGWICPLTPLENHFRRLAGVGEYSGDFVARYLLPLIYPENLTVTTQQLLGGLVIVVNVIFYAIAIQNFRSRRHR